ncbi:MAG: oxidoreductase [Haliea sp.]|nr:oxidoreductase [Haliea sp.]
MPVGLAHGVLWAVGLLPAAIAVLALPGESLAGTSAVLNALGRVSGIAGLGLMLVAAIFSVRIPGIDRLFGGLTSLWRTHHLMGGVSFLLLLAHPLLLSLAAAEVSIGAAVTVLFPATGGLATWLGWVALLLMMIFLAPSFAFFGPPRYQRWKHLHKLSGVAAVLALVHTWWLARSIPAPWSTVIWSTLALAAVIALAYALLLARRAHRYPYQVVAVAHPANNVVELSLRPLAEPLRYQAGQFVYLTPRDRTLSAGQGEEHPYTISSAPEEANLRIAIKDLGDASRAIQSISEGSSVDVMGPYGAFFPAHGNEAELWIAGGIGVTPFLGRARHLASAGHPVDIQMIYCVQDESRALFAEELRALSEQIPGFRLTMHYFYQEGPLSVDFVRVHCEDCGERQAYVCGPGPLNGLARQVLLESGLPRHRYHSEEFNLL